MKYVVGRLRSGINGITMDIFKRGSKGIYTLRMQVNGFRTCRSLQTTVLATARERAKVVAEGLRSGESGWAKIEALKVQKEYALCSEIEAAYKAWAPGQQPLAHVRGKNLQKLRQIVRMGLERDGDREWSAIVLTGDLVRRFQEAAIRSASEDEEGDLGTAKRTSNSMLTQARSVFANKEAFAALKLPDLKEFMEAPRLRLAENEKLQPFLPFTQVEVGLLQKEMERRRDEGEVGVWLTYLLMLHCGMRNEEVQHCKREWFDVQDNGTVELRIVAYPYYYPKASLGVVPVPAMVWREVDRLVPLKDPKEGSPWVIPGKTVTDRGEVTARAINGAMKAVLPERTAYDLRKMGGSNYYLQTGDILATASWLRHKSSSTSERWYVGLIKKLKPLGEIRGR